MNAHKAISLKTKLRVLLSLVAVMLLSGLSLRVDGASTSYTYDSLHRLTQATYPDGSFIAYTYDSAGNRLLQNITATPPPTPTPPPPTPTPSGTTPTPTPTPTTSSLGNISTRGFVQTVDNVLIGGFIIQGTTAKTVIVRAIGPELALPPYNIPGALTDPTLELHDGTGALIATNDNWQTTQIFGIITGDQVSDIQNSQKAPTQAAESAIVATLQPGNYTAIVRGASTTTGVALVEVYDLSPSPTSILGNISTRDFVQTDPNEMIGGFIIQGTAPKKVIVRAIGPELALPPYNIPGALADPTLELHDGTGTLIAHNDNWQTTEIFGIITGDQVSDIQNSLKAPTQASESAIIATLQPGNYTAIIRGTNNSTGVALVEVYDLD